MKDFKMGKKTITGHDFPTDFGFSGSTGKVKSVAPYTRSVPQKYAQGGKVEKISEGHSTTLRDQPANELDAETGGKTPLRPGFAKGGKMKKALGGPVRAAKGGALSAAGKGMKSGAEKKVAAAKSKMAPAAKGYGAFNRKPLIGR